MASQPSLSLAGRDMVIAVGLGCVTHYPANSGFRAEWFARIPSDSLYSVCPEIVNATTSGRALLRLGLIEPFTNPGQHSYRTAQLTPEGQARFDRLVTAEQRAAMVRKAANDARYEAQQVEARRQQAFREQHQDVLNALRDRARQRGSADHMLRAEMTQIAERLGRRPNDVEPLLERLRWIVDRLDAMAVEAAADAAATPRLDAPP